MLNILVVDDSLVVTNSIKKFLEELGHSVVGVAKNGLEAVSLANELNPDLIFMDIVMPEMTGLEALEKINKSNKDISIIMVTSIKEKDSMMDAFKRGAVGYIEKPVFKENIIDEIGNVFPKYKQLKSEDTLNDTI